MVPARQVGERLVALLVLGVLAFNYPVLSLFERVALWFGVPALFLYLFVGWLAFILAVAIAIDRRAEPSDGSRTEPSVSMDE